ncbi:MAG: hypothetical protein N2256_04795 [Tepidimonas ignava]|nr:hypothetical protein [Tepidimonas ignava]
MQVFNRVSVAVAVACMATFSHAGIVWQGSADQAYRNATAYLMSPQSKVAGLVWSLDPNGTGYTLHRQPGYLIPESAVFNKTPGEAYGFRPGFSYGFSSNNKAAVIDVPARVVVPGTSSTVPARIIEPLAKSTLAKSLLKAIPIVGNAYAVGELLQELGMAFRDGQFYESQSVSQQDYVVSDGKNYRYYAYLSWANTWIYGSWKLSPQSACNSFFSAAGSFIHSTDRHYDPVYKACNFKPPSGSSIYASAQTSVQTSTCPAGSFIYNGQCFTSVPNHEVAITQQRAIEKVEQQAPTERVISVLNGLPDNSDVIDVIVREVAEDPDDAEFRLPSPTGSYQVGDPVVEVETRTDGSTVERRRTMTATATGNRIQFQTSTEVITRDATGQETDRRTITSTDVDPSNPASSKQEDLECGLPGTPPCKIDETGTPQAPADDGQSVFRSLLPVCLQNDWKSCIPQLPNINWAFSLPSGCAPIPVPFQRYGFSNIDICPYQPVIHDLMSMLWAGAGLFAAIGILSGRRITED